MAVSLCKERGELVLVQQFLKLGQIRRGIESFWLMQIILYKVRLIPAFGQLLIHVQQLLQDIPDVMQLSGQADIAAGIAFQVRYGFLDKR
ncbi:hypothetical protein D3C73_1523710 [compost metagenome]